MAKYYTDWTGYTITNGSYIIRFSVRYWMNVTTNNSNTTTTATISVGADYQRTQSATSGVSGTYTLRTKITGTGKSDKTGTATISPGVDPSTSTHSVTLISSFTWDWPRGTSSATKTLTVYNNNDTSVKKATTITVPVLPTHTVSFNLNGGTGTVASQTKYYGVDLTINSTVPKRDGCTFLGWSTTLSAPDAGQVNYASGSTYRNDSDNATLYAVWEINYIPPSITYVTIQRCDSSGGSDDEGKYALVGFNWEVFTNKYSANEVDTITVSVGGETETVVPTATTTDTESVLVGDGSFDTDTEYTVTISVTDTVGEQTTTYTGTLGTALFPIDISASGRAIGMFQPAPSTSGTTGLFVNGDITSYADITATGDVTADNVIDGTGNLRLTSETPTLSITDTTGSLKSYSCRRFGNVAQLRLTFNNSSAVASGANIYEGTLNTTALRPRAVATGASYYGAHAIGGMLNTVGSITIRNASSSSVTISGDNTATVSFTYIL